MELGEHSLGGSDAHVCHEGNKTLESRRAANGCIRFSTWTQNSWITSQDVRARKDLRNYGNFLHTTHLSLYVWTKKKSQRGKVMHSRLKVTPGRWIRHQGPAFFGAPWATTNRICGEGGGQGCQVCAKSQNPQGV